MSRDETDYTGYVPGVAQGGVQVMSPTEQALLEALQGVFRKHAKPGYEGNPYLFPPEWEEARIAIYNANLYAMQSK